VRTRLTTASGAALASLAYLGTAGSADTGLTITGLTITGVALAGVLLVLLLALFIRRALAARPGSARRKAGGRPTITELWLQAAGALVAADDSVRTSEQELGFAVATFGQHAAAPFSAAVDSAKAELAGAFELRQQLDDELQRTQSARRTALRAICAHCVEVSRLLDEQSESFDRLQDLQARTPAVFAEADAHAAQQSARLGRSRQILEHLATKYAPAAVAAVSSNPGQAAERLEFASDSLAGARRELAADQASQAAVFLRAAESAADQASDLLDAIEHLESELTQAASALPQALREIDADIAEAGELSPSRHGRDVGGRLFKAKAAVSTVRSQLAGGAFDALAALRMLEHADTALDRALAGTRNERDRRDRASAVLDQGMLLARSSVTAAEDFITARRGGVGARARTRLAAAHRHFQHALACAVANPESALTAAHRCDELGQEARTLAGHDVARFAGAHASPRHGRRRLGVGLRAAILGGILIGNPPGPAGRVSQRPASVSQGPASVSQGPASVGPDASVSGSAQPSFAPGSFGGVRTRGRNSVDGCFSEA
jgi:hypothetical protein